MAVYPTATVIVIPQVTATATRLPNATFILTATVQPNLLHIGDLASSSVLAGMGKWNAVVTILVHSANEVSWANVTVSGKWTSGFSGGSSCTTNSAGTCMLTKTGLSTRTASVTFSVNTAGKIGYTYMPSANHDATGDSLEQQ